MFDERQFYTYKEPVNVVLIGSQLDFLLVSPAISLYVSYSKPTRLLPYQTFVHYPQILLLVQPEPRIDIAI